MFYSLLGYGLNDVIIDNLSVSLCRKIHNHFTYIDFFVLFVHPEWMRLFSYRDSLWFYLINFIFIIGLECKSNIFLAGTCDSSVINGITMYSKTNEILFLQRFCDRTHFPFWCDPIELWHSFIWWADFLFND